MLLMLNGRIAGISGILEQVIGSPKRAGAWRWAFLAGLILTGCIALLIAPHLFPTRMLAPWPVMGLGWPAGGFWHKAWRRVHLGARGVRDEPALQALVRGDADVHGHRRADRGLCCAT